MTERPFETEELEPVLEPVAEDPKPTVVRTYGQASRVIRGCC